MDWVLFAIAVTVVVAVASAVAVAINRSPANKIRKRLTI